MDKPFKYPVSHQLVPAVMGVQELRAPDLRVSVHGVEASRTRSTFMPHRCAFGMDIERS